MYYNAVYVVTVYNLSGDSIIVVNICGCRLAHKGLANMAYKKKLKPSQIANKSGKHGSRCLELPIRHFIGVPNFSLLGLVNRAFCVSLMPPRRGCCQHFKDIHFLHVHKGRSAGCFLNVLYSHQRLIQVKNDGLMSPGSKPNMIDFLS